VAGKTIMGHFERLHKFDEPEMSDHERLNDVKREISRDWQEYRRELLLLHGQEISDSKLDALILFLIKRGLI